MEWISVEDRLPTAYVEVLVWPPKYFDDEPTTYTGQLHQHEGNQWWVTYGNGIVYNHSKVTHWMPLPEPPKETEGNPLIEMHLSVDPGMADSIEETE